MRALNTSTFFGIETALRGLEAQQAAMDVTSHNISNASTPGYSRQMVDLETTDPYADPTIHQPGAGQIGTGVDMVTVNRAHDDYVQQQILSQNGAQSQDQELSDTLTRVAQVFNDPSDQGFSTGLSAFFTSWQQLANNPSDNPTRSAVIAQGNALAAQFNAASTSLQTMRQNEEQRLGPLVTQVNTITGQIAALNKQIASVASTGQQPNDLLDKRDTLLNTLSGLVNVQTVNQSNGMVNVSLVGGGSLVQGLTSNNLSLTPSAANPPFSDITLQGQTTPASIGGQIGGILTARDVTIKGQLDDLDTLANNLMTAVNGFQTAGYDAHGNPGAAFFTGTTAGTMAVNPAVAGDPGAIAAAAAPGSPGDGSQALKIAQLQENPAPGATATLQAQYASTISALGVAGQQAQTRVQTGSVVLQNLNAQQSSVSSVSLNEEASNLMRYQNAYEAVARVITTLNQSISDMINELGG